MPVRWILQPSEWPALSRGVEGSYTGLLALYLWRLFPGIWTGTLPNPHRTCEASISRAQPDPSGLQLQSTKITPPYLCLFLLPSQHAHCTLSSFVYSKMYLVFCWDGSWVSVHPIIE